MPPVIPALDLACPDPGHCPVVATLPRLRTVTVPAGTGWYRVYNATWGYDEFNPGYGDTRFSPVDDPAGGDRLPSMYLAASPAAALLESVFHDVHQLSARIVYERDLRGMLLAHLATPAVGRVADLRDPELQRLGLRRDAIVSSSAEHYPCTRRHAVTALARRKDARSLLHGLIWHSRQAELAGAESAEVMVLFGAQRYPTARGAWTLFGPGASSLYDGAGRLLAEEVAEMLSATIELET